jgi:AcrR family transcriptional regulator
MTSNEQKKQQILDTSLAVFCQYGFHKTSMLDIAQAAGMSRAALYLHFKNKEDVFRSGSERAHSEVLRQVETALAAGTDVMKRIEGAVSSFLQGLMQQISASAHGQELFDANMALAGDITRQARTKLVSVLAKTLADADAAGEIDLASVGAQPMDLAGMIVATVDGIKHAQGGGSAFRDGISLFMRLLGAALLRNS